jgi:hypothetical protein
MNYELILPPLVVTAQNQSLIFKHICLIHTSDVGQISISKDWGNTFKGSRWFDQSVSTNFVKGDLTASKYEEAGVDLRPYIGDTVLIRFSLFSNPVVTDLGWYVDDIITDGRVGVEEKPVIADNSLRISPNPVNSFANIQFNLLSESPAQIEIVDMLGNSVHSINLGLISEYNSNVQVDLNSIPVGTYYVRLIAGNSQIVRPLSITR